MGRRFSGYVRRWLRIETERQSSQSARIEHLEALLRANGISPTEGGEPAEEYRLLAKSRESALAAVRVYNEPDAGFRTETFVVLMVIAWNSLLQAVLERASVDYYERDEGGAKITIGRSEKVLGHGNWSWPSAVTNTGQSEQTSTSSWNCGTGSRTGTCLRWTLPWQAKRRQCSSTSRTSWLHSSARRQPWVTGWRCHPNWAGSATRDR